MKTDRKITINILPQSEGAWPAIAMCVLFISFAWGIRGCADAIARENEARYNQSKPVNAIRG